MKTPVKVQLHKFYTPQKDCVKLKTLKPGILCVVFALLLILSGCSKPAKEFDPDGFSKDMLASSIFSDEITLTDNSIGCRLYGIAETDAESMAFYFSSGATAEEMVILKAHDQNGVKMLSDAVKNRIDYQKSAFKSYVPTEVPKLEKAVTSISGMYVVMYVAADYDAAKKVADKYLGA